MRSPNYGELLRALWSQPNATTPIAKTDCDIPSPDTDIADLLGESILWQETLPAQQPERQDIPQDLPRVLIEALAAINITQLYSHQSEALSAIRASKDLIITTPTASGKTLSIYPGVIEGCIREKSRCLSFYPLKALASDQFDKLTQLTQMLPKHHRPRLAMLNGDIKSEERQRLLSLKPHIIGCTPELIHFELRNSWKSEAWLEFWRRLRYICIDEAHTLTGPLGASLALLLRRIKLKVDAAGGNARKLQFIFLSATVGNPVQLAMRLSGRNNPKQLVWIEKSGAASPEKRLLVLQPSTHPNTEAAKVVTHLMRQELSGIVFCNSRAAVKNLALTTSAQAKRIGYPELGERIAMFYGSLTSDRRTEIIKALEAGKLKVLVSTSALEAGIDLPVLDYAIIVGWPGSVMSLKQRLGRAGRTKKTGLGIFIPRSNPLDRYFSAHIETLLAGAAEQVSFNSDYPILLAKHLLCAAAETGIPESKIEYYFGNSATKVVSVLMEQEQIFRGRNGLWTRGFPHKDINFRGGTTQRTIKLVTEQGEELEQLNEDAAYKEVYPGGIYRCQSPNGQITTFLSTGLDINSLKATMKEIGETPQFTVAVTESLTKVKDRLTDPRQFPVALQHPQIGLEPSTELSQVRLELNWGEINQLVTGYQALSKQYAPTCFNQKCPKYNIPLPNHPYCPNCNKKTKGTELTTLLDQTSFTKPYQTKFSTPIVEIYITTQVRKQLKAIVSTMKKSLIKENETSLPPGYQTLWEADSSFIALHSLGHQLIAALPLVVLSSTDDLNYVVDWVSEGIYVGRFYDLTDGGNGAVEALFQNFQELANRAVQLAQSCDCLTGCPKCLQQHNCPQGNKALLKQLGLILLKAVAEA